MDHERVGHAVGSALAGLLAGGLMLAAVSMAADIARRAGVPVEVVSGRLVALAVGAVILVAVGVVAFAVTKNRDIVMFSALAAFLILLTIAGLFSIGIIVLPFAIGAVYLLWRRSAGRPGLTGALLAGPAIAIGLAFLLVVWAQPPLVTCTDGGASVSSPPWWTSGTSTGGTGSGMQSAGRDVTTGSIDTPDGSYVFRCTGDELTQFRRVGAR